MEGVLEVYERPLDPAQPVVCVDETPVQLLKDVRPPRPAREPGQIAKYDNEYERCGTCNIFGVVEPKAGRHFTQVTPNRGGAEFAKLMLRVADAYPEAETIHLVMDNLNTHTRKSLTDYFGAEEGAARWDRFTVHYTPKHGSWLNQAEIELNLVSRQCLGKRRMGTLTKLRRNVRAWRRRADRRKLKIEWTFDRKAARRKFKYRARKRTLPGGSP